MHIAIDDTYGPEMDTGSAFVSGDRRTHVALIFPDADAQYVRDQVIGCLDEMTRLTNRKIAEFHFVDIYNRKPPWDSLQNQGNLGVFEFFAHIYKLHLWPVMIQTIDDRTLRDHGIDRIIAKVDGFDLSDRADLSLFWLLIRIKMKYKHTRSPITLILDEGREKPGIDFGYEVFHDWPSRFQGFYASSASEPLLQIADFIAFCMNRSTHLAMKQNRTDVDNWFLNLVGNMGINCDDLKVANLPFNFSISDFDAIHRSDREDKGLGF